MLGCRGLRDILFCIVFVMMGVIIVDVYFLISVVLWGMVFGLVEGLIYVRWMKEGKNGWRS